MTRDCLLNKKKHMTKYMVCLDQRTFYKYRYYAGFRICRVFNEKRKYELWPKILEKFREKIYCSFKFFSVLFQN